MILNLDVITTTEEAESICQVWRELAPTPMQSPDWLLPWWVANRSSQSTLKILTCRNASQRIVGILPLFHHESWGCGSSIRFLGSGQACSDYQTVLAHPDFSAETVATYARWFIDNCDNGAIGYCEFDGVSSQDVAMKQLLDGLQESGLLVQRNEIENSWRLTLSDAWTDVLALQSKTQRRQSRNLLNRLDKSPELQVREYNADNATREKLSELMQLHQAHWQDVCKPGCFADERFVRFISRAAGRLAPRNQWLIRTLYVDERPAASQLLLLDSAKAYVYQSGRAPEFDAMRVGRILNLDTARTLAERRFQFIDYLRGDEVYKGRMGAIAEQLYRVRVVSSKPRPQIQHASIELARKIKRSVKMLARVSGLQLGG